VTEVNAKERDIHLCLLKVHGFIAAQGGDDSLMRQSLAMFMGLNVGLVIGMRDVHTAKLVMAALRGTDDGLVENIVEELMRIVEREGV
jgi:hypothetical protein